jgi:hypothetical protein
MSSPGEGLLLHEIPLDACFGKSCLLHAGEGSHGLATTGVVKDTSGKDNDWSRKCCCLFLFLGAAANGNKLHRSGGAAPII